MPNDARSAKRKNPTQFFRISSCAERGIKPMKTYEKMKAAIVDLSNVLDEALAFEELKRTRLQPAFAGNAGGNIRMMNDLTSRNGDSDGVTYRPAAAPEPYALPEDDGYMVINNS